MTNIAESTIYAVELKLINKATITFPKFYVGIQKNLRKKTLNLLGLNPALLKPTGENSHL